MTTTVKITELPNIGANLATSTLVPVVNMAGTPTTQKATVGNIANLVLTGAGVDYPEASVALLAQTVSNAAQPNITSTGTLTSLDVDGNVSAGGNLTINSTAYLGNISTTGVADITTLVVGTTADLGDVSNITIGGGSDGYVLQTDGTGNLSWTAQTGGGGGNGTPGGSNTQIQFNDAGSFGGNSGFTFNKTTGILASPFLTGNGNGLSNIQGANISGAVGLATYATTANSVAVANVSGLSNIATIALNGSSSQVLYGNGVWATAGGGGSTGNITFSGDDIASTNDIVNILGNNYAELQSNNTYMWVEDGEADIEVNGNRWIFDSTGNLTLPDNTFAVNYANGQQVQLGGAALGNLTVDNITLQGTYELDLSPGPDATANSKVLRVRAGDVDSHIHFDTGNNFAYDQYFGDDSKYLKLEAGLAGNVLVGTYQDGGVGRLDWIFDSNGNLTVPGSIKAKSTGIPFNATITAIDTFTYPTPPTITVADNIFGDPVTGQVTISNLDTLTGCPQANGTWYYQAVDYNQFTLYYDAGLTQPVVTSDWTAYLGGGGDAVSPGTNDLSIVAGNLIVETNTGETWKFDNNGDLNAPANSFSFGTGRIQSANGYPTLLGYGSDDHGGPELDWMNSDNPNDYQNANVLRNTLYLNDNGLYVGFNENGNGNAYVGSWQFTPDGKLVAPILTTTRGDVSSSTITGSTLNIGNGSQEAIITTPDATSYNAQRLVINPGKGQDGTAGEGGDIYLWAGRGGDTDGNGGDIKIRGGYGPGNGQGGYIRIEGGDVQGTGTPGYVDLKGGDHNGGNGGYVQITGGGGYTGTGGDANVKGGYGSLAGGNVNIWGGGSSSGQSTEGYVHIQTGGNTWSYGSNGVLNLPSPNSAGKYIKGAVEAIYGDPYPAGIANATPSVVWTASSSNVIGGKATVRVQYSDGTNVEMFDIMMAKQYNNSNVSFSVSNRLKTNDLANDTTVLVDLDGSNQLTISLTSDYSAYITYSITEFYNTFD